MEKKDIESKQAHDDVSEVSGDEGDVRGDVSVAGGDVSEMGGVRGDDVNGGKNSEQDDADGEQHDARRDDEHNDNDEREKDKKDGEMDIDDENDDKDKEHKSVSGNKRQRELFCVCHRPHDKRRYMLGCDGPHCPHGGWFHPVCLGLTLPTARKIADTQSQWLCKSCVEPSAE